MSYTKPELIDKIVGLLLQSGVFEGRAAVVSAADRAFLERSSVDFLERKYQQIKNEIAVAVASKRRQQQVQIMGDRNREDLAWTHISRVIVDGKMPITNEANRQIVFSWLHEDQGEQPTVEWFKKVLEENPALKNQITWEPVMSPEQRKQAEARQLEQDKVTFSGLCRRNSLSDCEANFNLWRSTNSISGLAAASPEESEAYRQEAVEQHNEALLRIAETDPSKLRTIVRQEAEQRRAADQQTEADRQLATAKARDAVMGFPPLPDTWQGQKLDAAFIRTCDVPTQKLLTRRFGSAQLTARLRGVA
jgi:hypothetical protein